MCLEDQEHRDRGRGLTVFLKVQSKNSISPRFVESVLLNLNLHHVSDLTLPGQAKTLLMPLRHHVQSHVNNSGRRMNSKISNSFSIGVSYSPLHNADSWGPKAKCPGQPTIQGIHKVILATEPNTLPPTPPHHSLLTHFRRSHHHWVRHLGSFCCKGIAWG